jgi:hypothetical protein
VTVLLVVVGPGLVVEPGLGLVGVAGAAFTVASAKPRMKTNKMKGSTREDAARNKRSARETIKYDLSTKCG